jgi:hypothetical protein
MDQTPLSSNLAPSAKPGASTSMQQGVSEEQLITKLKKLMKMNIKNMCYTDAIFFADKILHL